MAGRALAFSDDEIIRMGAEEYVSVAADDWYQRRRRDDEGEFFRRVANQGPRKGEGGATRQGVYVLTASGKLLVYANRHRDPAAMRQILEEGLEKWRSLPKTERMPGAVQIDEPDFIDPTYTRTLPTGGLILKVYARALDRVTESDDSLACDFTDAVCPVGGGNESSRDHLWLTDAEWKGLFPEDSAPGDRYPVPVPVAERILRFHLVDNTRGEPDMWRQEDIRHSHLELYVEESTPKRTRVRLEGSALLMTDADPDLAERGYDVELLGHLDYDRAGDSVRRFDIVAIGDHWGEGRFTRRARPGKMPLGIAFELGDDEKRLAHVPPQGARNVKEYFGSALESSRLSDPR